MAPISKSPLGELFIDKGLIDKAVQRRIDYATAAGFPSEVLTLIDRETAGGPCPRCSRPWSEIVVDNPHGSFTYYEPDCRCYPRCPGPRGVMRGGKIGPWSEYTCGEWLYEDFVIDGRIQCSACESIEEAFFKRKRQKNLENQAPQLTFKRSR